MSGKRDRELFQHGADLVDLADQRIDTVVDDAFGRSRSVLQRREPAAELGDLACEIGGAARQIGDLAAHGAAIPDAHRDGVEQHHEGEGGERHDRSFDQAETGECVERHAKRCRDQNHADRNKDRGNANHRKRTSQPRPAA